MTSRQGERSMLVGAGRGLLLLLARAAAFLFCLLLAPAARAFQLQLHRGPSSSTSNTGITTTTPFFLRRRRRATMSADSSSESEGKGAKFNFSWQQTMLRIKDPAKSLPFYEEVLGFKRLHEYKFETFSLYFMYIPRPGETLPPPGTKESEAFLWSMQGTVLELTWNHGTEADGAFQYNNGNVEPHRGFGHIAVACDDVYASCAMLEAAGVPFQKKPDEGRMKGLAFIKDPDGYWIEVISRDAATFGPTYPAPYTFAQTMLRVKDPKASLRFYRDLLGMKLLCVKHFPEAHFSLYFLGQRLPEGEAAATDPEAEASWGVMKRMHDPVLELTHNHGTEDDPAFAYHNGNTDPRGFGHVGFLCDDLEGACTMLEAEGVAFQKKPQDGSMRGLAFAKDPDGYWVELVGRGLTI